MLHATTLAALTVAAVGLAASPYLAALTVSVPDREAARWWRGRHPSRPALLWTAVLAVVFGTLAGRAVGWTAALPAFAGLALAATPLALIDIVHHRLPDRLVLAAAASGTLLLCAAALATSDGAALARAAEAALAVFAAFFLLALVSPQSLGFGDVKLAGLLGGYLGWLGWGYVLYGIVAGFGCGALAAMALLVTRRASLRAQFAFGPALIAGALLVAAAHPAL